MNRSFVRIIVADDMYAPCLFAAARRFGPVLRKSRRNKSPTMSFAARSTLVRTATAARAGCTRNMSSEAKLHKAKDMWAELQKTRPPKDHMDEHVSSRSSLSVGSLFLEFAFSA